MTAHSTIKTTVASPPSYRFQLGQIVATPGALLLKPDEY